MDDKIEVYKAITAVQDDIAKIGISKDKKNAQQGYSFRGIDDVYDALAPILARHKLCIIPYVLTREVVERQTRTGGTLFYTTVECEFHFVSAIDGSSHIAKTFGEAMDSADKSTNKAMSAAYKYAAFQTFCIPVEAQDVDATTHEVMPEYIKEDQIAELRNLIQEKQADETKFLVYMKYQSLDKILASDFEKALKALQAKKAPDYITPQQKKMLEAIIGNLKLDRELVKEYFYLKQQCGETNGRPTLDKLYRVAFDKIVEDEKAFVITLQSWFAKKDAEK